MPYTLHNLAKNKVSVTSPNGVRAKSTTASKAKKQIRLLNAIDHGFKPTRRKPLGKIFKG